MRFIRGRIKDAIASAGKIIRATVLGLGTDENIEEIENTEVFSMDGFTSCPEDDSECIAIQSGHRTIVIAGTDRTTIPALSTGDKAMHAAADQYVIIRKNGDIEIKCKAGSQININNGNLTVDT